MDYLNVALTNAGVFTALDIQSTIFSQGRICVLDKEGNEIEDDPFLKLISNPNFTQSQQDFLYQHLFFKGLGNNITRVIANNDSPNDINQVVSLENLVPNCIDYNNINKVNKFVFAKSDVDAVKEQHINYNLNTKKVPIPINQLMFFYDVSNGLEADKRFKSPSRLRSLHPAIKNIDQAQKTKNINLKFSAKRIVSEKQKKASEDYDGVLLGNKEKHEVEEKVYQKDIMATSKNLDVHSLASDFRKLMLDDSCASSFQKIASAYGIPSDVVSWFLNGQSTYENKKVAIAEWIQNSIQFQADDTANTWTSQFNYQNEGKKIVIKYDHLPAMQVMEEQRMNATSKKIEIAKGLVELGVEAEQAREYVGLNITV